MTAPTFNYPYMRIYPEMENTQLFWTSHIYATLKILNGLCYVTNACAFFQFIVEEALQSGLMACYVAQKQHNLFKALPTLEHLYTKTLVSLVVFNRTAGDIAFWCKIPFEMFAKATRLCALTYAATLHVDIENAVSRAYFKQYLGLDPVYTNY